MAGGGWIALYRSLEDHWIWENPTYLKWWLDILFMVNHKENKFLFDGQLISVGIGERITSEVKLAERWGVSRNTVRKFLDLLVSDEMISLRKSRKSGTWLKVRNYADYQSPSGKTKQQTEHPVEHPTEQPPEQLTEHKQQVNNDNNDNNVNNSPRNTRKKRVYADDDPNKKLAKLLFKLISKNQDIQEPDLDKWANTIRLTIEADKRTGKEVQEMIVWSSQSDFWSGVILSPTSLRKNFDKMAAQKNKQKKSNRSSAPFVEPERETNSEVSF